MAIPTVFIVGVERLPLIPEFLNLGSVVVVAPDHETLRDWSRERDAETTREAPAPGSDATAVDLAGRRITSGGMHLPLSDLEFRVLSLLLSPIGQARSFREIRQHGWGDRSEIPDDVYSVRALVQRLRAKLETVRADVRIHAVRGFGFRADLTPTPTERGLRTVPQDGAK